jgi:S-formylglutathione hydrolase FrmB
MPAESDDILRCPLHSPFQGGETTLRVLLPDRMTRPVATHDADSLTGRGAETLPRVPAERVDGQGPHAGPANRRAGDRRASPTFRPTGARRASSREHAGLARTPANRDDRLPTGSPPPASHPSRSAGSVREPPAPSPHRFLFVLPVEAGEETRYGDGLLTVKALDLHNRFDLIAVAPTFRQIPWYSDHPTDPDIRQESYMIQTVLPAVDQLFPSSQPCRLLLGFSKSGWGAVSLLVRHPDLFTAAAAWDTLLMIDGPSGYQMHEVFATQQNFDRYYLPRLLTEKAPLLRQRKRLSLSGYGNFRDDLQRAHRFLEQLQIPHHYADGPERPHHWDSGWVEEAVETLLAAE